MPVNPGRSIWVTDMESFDPGAAWEFFSGNRFDKKLLDDGLSQSWAVAFTVGMFLLLLLLYL